MISPKESQAFGLAVSAVTGLTVFTVVWGFFVWKLDFWYLDTVLGPVLGFLGGALSAYAMYTTGLRDIPLNWLGVGLLLGKPDETLYENGIQWVSPFGGIRICPGKDQKFIIQMPGEKINAQDGIAIFFGVSEVEHPGKHNRLQYSVVDPKLYIAVDNPEDSLRKEFIEKARLFFGQARKAIGVKNVRLLFDTYLCLPPEDTDPNDVFKAQLKAAKFVPTGKTVGQATDTAEDERLFSDESAETLMKLAGEFRKTAETWGIGKIDVFTPNVRVNPAAEAAAERKQAELENMAGLETRTDKVITLATKMKKEAGVNPDLAVTMVAGLSGQSVVIENKTINISGLPEAIKGLGELVINKFAKT